MKIRILSDLHLEFANLKVPELATDAETVLVLAGDIHVGLRARNWIEELAPRFAHIVYVMGNHEYYQNDISEVNTRWAEALLPSNVHVLLNRSVVLDKVLFIGSTLWTDFDRGNVGAMLAAKRSMTDYRVIGWDNRGLTPNDVLGFYESNYSFLHKALLKRTAPSQKVVVVTHHLPSWNLIDEKYAGDDISNAAYAANADNLIPYADVWIHGHTHETVEKTLGDCRVFCNPRGYYPSDLNSNFNSRLVIEV